MKAHFTIAHPLAVFCTLAVFSLLSSCQGASLTIADSGKSTFSIVVPKLAPVSVIDAAREMQRDIEESTGAKLPIVKDDAPAKSTFISLGSTKQAAAAGITADGVAESGFRIVTKEGNLYILGPDTTTEDMSPRWSDDMAKTQKWEPHPEIPGPAFTKDGGFSTGTANGVYTFLEDYLGMRWLMPGEIGRDVPRKSTFTIDNINRTETSPFTFRVMVIIDSPQWRKHMKMGYSYNLKHTHAQLVPDSLYKAHPDWFAMGANGKRLDPRKNQGKYETTNQDLVKYVADETVKELKEHPDWATFSISPRDGLGFSQSPESKALYDENKSTPNGPSITPLILKFYSDVSNIVAKQYPQGKVSGYLYSTYRYPPSNADVHFPKNFVPVLVNGANSFKLYDPKAREKEFANINAWGKFAPPTWFYYGYPSYISAGNGTVTPAGASYLTELFHTLDKNHIKGFNYYGSNSWSQTAMANYVAAKLLWNPKADGVAIEHDWLMRAYGPKAGAVMVEFYDKMDTKWFYEYYSNPNPAGSRATEAFFSGIYGKYYPEMEKLVIEAEAQPMTAIQKERLRLISDNMRLLQWRLRNAGYLKQDYTSPYTITTQQVYELLSDTDDSRGFVKFGYIPVRAQIDEAEVQIGQPQANSGADIPNPDRILFYPTKDMTVRITPSNVRSGSSYLFYYIRDENGKQIARGILENGGEITFDAKANVAYYLRVLDTGVSRNPQIKWDISVADGVSAKASSDGKVLTLTADKVIQPLLVYVPDALDRIVEDSESGVSVRFQTSEQQKSQAMRAAGKAAKATLAVALEKYHATLIQSLDSGWQFATDPDQKGLQQGFDKPDFNDSSWKSIPAVGPWQLHGFEDYRGTAWYRKTFTVSKDTLNEPELMGKFLLFVGAVDGDANFYLNGRKISERRMSDDANSWQMPFAIDVSNALVPGKNVLSVEVTKARLAAGLYKGVSILNGTLEK